MKELIQNRLEEVVKKLTGKSVEISISIPKDISKGDFSSNIAFHLAKELQKSPINFAGDIVKEFGNLSGIDYIEPALPGFINFYLSKDALSENIKTVLNASEKVGASIRM